MGSSTGRQDVLNRERGKWVPVRNLTLGKGVLLIASER